MNTKRQKEDSCFIAFNSDVSEIEPPIQFTFPFYYTPHALSELAAQQLQVELLKQNDWKHDFGLPPSNTINSGKMFGVLVVKNTQGELGFLQGFSGKLTDTSKPKGFVPHVYDLLPGKNFFEVGMEKINAITARIKSIEEQLEFVTVAKDLELLKQRAALDIADTQLYVGKAKSERSAFRKEQQELLNKEDFAALNEKLNNESVQKKFYFKHLQEHWKNKLAKAEFETHLFYQEYEELRSKRKSGSIGLQQKIFEHYEFLNAKGETRNLRDIFEKEGVHLPPAGSGDCAAPKLIQYAYKMGYKPICMAEFWWGQSPKSEIKKHVHYYPACTGKCQPILSHMLQGLSVEPNPMETGTMDHLQIQTVFEDAHMLVINKPSGLLSVPGKSVADSVANRLKTEHPDWTGPLIVHRLDMPTSGVLLIAKSLEIHKILQQQFLKRTITKRYIAILDGVLKEDEGTIDLPLRVDLENRPHQLVCQEHGKSARTHFKVISRTKTTTRIHFYPITGRTHQLRMHAAHKDGLNLSIVGDALYGQKAARLYLHAEQIGFTHPVSGEIISIAIDPVF
ncbi:MAG: tRNA pseudouridine32 synthase/23S rRNA pseudouridine746 synthase [Salibacteraceae bacterium]|jgi:tRNA pseudouridine32 synthase/23S rRNA pseudouridine746 synthase